MSEKKQKEYPHRPRKEIDMDQYLILYRQGLPNRQIASRLKVSPRNLYRRMEEELRKIQQRNSKPKPTPKAVRQEPEQPTLFDLGL